MKKFSAIIICLLMFLTCTLTGCAGFSVNKVKYYNEVVATVGTTKITRFELLNTYNNNSSYYTQNGQSENEALNEVLDLLINREALYQYALNYEQPLGANPYYPTEYQINEIVKSIFDSVDSQLESYVKDAKNVLNIEIVDDSATEEETTTLYKREDYNYKKRATLVIDGTKTVRYKDAEHTQLADASDTDVFEVEEPNYVIKYITESEPEKGSYKELIDEDFLKNYALTRTASEQAKDIYEEVKNKYLQHFKDNLLETDEENANAIYEEVLKALSKNLINYEFYLRDANGKPYNKVTNDLLYRYFKRMVDSQIKTQYLTNFQEYYLENEELSLNELLKAYGELATHDYNKYNGYSADYKTDMKNTSTDFEKIVYHPNIDDDAQFGYFLHTLFQFSDEQKTEISNLSKKYNNKNFKDYSAEYKEKLENPELDEQTKQNLTKEFNEYKDAYSAIVLNTKVVVRNIADGSETDDSNNKTLKEVLTGLKNGDFNNLLNNPNIYEFVNFMFTHTQDNATLTASSPYVVGSYNKDKGETYSTNSSMEEAFTEEAIKLMKTGKNNSISEFLNDGEFDVENLCITSYGVHILYYICPLYENDIANSNISKVYLQTRNRDDDPNGQFNLYTKYLNPLSELKGKTYFDLLFDLVYPASNSTFTSNTNYSEYEKNLAEMAKNTYKVVKYATRIKATKTDI